MKSVIIVLAFVMVTVMAIPLQKQKEKVNPSVLNPEKLEVIGDDVKRGKRQFGFGGGASGAESVSLGLNTPIGNIGLSESSSFANQNNFGLGGFGGYPGRFGGHSGRFGGYPGRFGHFGGGSSYANGFNGGFNGPFGGGLGISGSQAGSYNSELDF